MAAERSPAFQFYPKDFLSSDSVSMMTVEQVGAYILLLSHAWLRPEGLPGSMADLARLARVPQRRFEDKIWPRLSECFVSIDGAWHNERLEQERVKQAEFREAASRAGKRSAEQRSFNARSTNLPTEAQRSVNGNPTLLSAVCSLQSASAERTPQPPLRGAVSGRGATFWAEWRRLMLETSGVALTLEPKAGDLEAIVEVLEQVPEDERLFSALDRFMRLTPGEARDLAVKAKSIRTFRMALPRLLEARPMAGVTARTSGNAAALAAFVAKGKPS